MATLNDRPFSKDYAGLENQSVIAGGLIVLCLLASAVMKRKRRHGARNADGLGSVESWEFGYLFQGRSWARNASPPLPLRYPFQWVKQAILLKESEVLDLRGLDAAVYVRFLRGGAWFAFVHTLTTFPILLPIHVHFAGPDVSIESMTRASISSLVETNKGRSLLWVHLVLLFWITGTWLATLAWICKGALANRRTLIRRAAQQQDAHGQQEREAQYHPHPHPQYVFSALPPLDRDRSTRGIRLRSVMVTNIQSSLRDEKELADYFAFYLAKPAPKPLPLTTRGRPGLTSRIYRFLFQRQKVTLEAHPDGHHSRDTSAADSPVPAIERVVIVRKMTELASLLERREVVLRKLETAHIALAQRALAAVRDELLRREGRPTLSQRMHDAMGPKPAEFGVDSDMDELVRALAPFVHEFGLMPEGDTGSWRRWRRQSRPWANLPEPGADKRTVWDALHALPRGALDAYQPLVRLSVLFRDKTVPAVDYYAAKLGLLTGLIAENRAKPAGAFDAVSTAFVTFGAPADALRACQTLAVHPDSLASCVVTMAPCFEDLDWMRLMKSTYRGEFVKDWVVNVGVWAFTIFWLFPLSFFVGLVSIQALAVHVPALARYLRAHPWQEDVLQSFVPTLIVALLTLLIPILLLLIAKKAHTLLTLSALHDRIMTRYYKFLIVNILVFFCVGTAAVQSILVSIGAPQDTTNDVLTIIASSFPSAGPFYVGWMIFTTGIHSALESALFGLPLITYLFTRKAKTPRKRAVGIRPRTLNYYYWLPNHMLIFHVLAVFSVLNPLVIPFTWIYFMIDMTVIKNQLLHVYAKVYEQNGKLLLVRIIRYSLDGLTLLQAVFIAYMAVLKIKVNIALSAVLIILTVFSKLAFTRVVRAQFDADDLIEGEVRCGMRSLADLDAADAAAKQQLDEAYSDVSAGDAGAAADLPTRSRLWRTWKNMDFNYGLGTAASGVRRAAHRGLNPFARPHPPLAAGADSAMASPSPIAPPDALRGPDGAPVPREKLAGAIPLLERRMSRTHEWRQSQAGARPAEKRATSPSPERRQSAAPALARQQSIAQRLAGADAPPLVTPHPPHPRWDDEPDPDKAYENPYYSAPIGSALWLPRNPCGLLDLDDTVDVHRALTTVAAAGALGEWRVPEEEPAPPVFPTLLLTPGDDGAAFPLSASPEEEDPPLSTSPPRSVGRSTTAASAHSRAGAPSLLLTVNGHGRALTGAEGIALPPRIEARVGDAAEFDDELAPDSARSRGRARRGRRPSTATTRQSSRGSRELVAELVNSARTRRESNLSASSAYFSATSGSRRRATTIDAEHGFVLGAAPRRGLTADQQAQLAEASEQGVRPDAGPQAALLHQASFGSLPGSAARHRHEPTLVTMQEAVQAEVVQEEQEAADARLREEAQEAIRSTRRRGWWTRWAFSAQMEGAMGLVAP